MRCRKHDSLLASIHLHHRSTAAAWLMGCIVAAWLPVTELYAQTLQTAGTLYVNLRATHSSAGSAVWTNEGTLGSFNVVGAPSRDTNVLGTGLPGVLFNGTTDAYEGPNSVADIDGGGDRSVEVWAFNPAIAQEETTVSWGHRQTTRRDMAFNFGNNTTWGAATHWADDVSWGGLQPSAAAWHYLAYTYSNSVVRVYVDGVLANSKTLGGPLDTFPGEPINIGCQRETALGTRSLLYSGYLNTVRIHGGVLSSAQIQSNFVFGAAGAPTNAPATPTGLAASPGYNEAWLNWNTSGGASRYSVKRSANSGGPYSDVVTNLSSPGYLDTGLGTGATWYYKVSAANTFGESTNSNPVSVTTGAPSQPFIAGTLYVDLRATNSTAGSATWVNEASLGNFSAIGGPTLVTNVGGTHIPGVSFNGTSDAYEGPNSVPDLDGGSDRSIEVWAYNPSLAQEETTVSWGHRGSTRQDIAFNFGNNPTWGAATHWADDVSWNGTPPTDSAWHHLVYTYENSTVRVYSDGVLINTDGLGGVLNTFPGEPINLGCQRETALGTRSLLYSGYLNLVRIHGGVLNPAQVQANYYLGPSTPPAHAVNDFITLNPGAKARINVLANDAVSSITPSSAVLVSGPSAGTAIVQSDGWVLYTHNGGPATSDQFSYKIQNSLGQTSDVAQVFVTISGAMRLPNTTMTIPDAPPPLTYQLVDAFPGLTTVTQVLAMRTPPGPAYSNLLFCVERRGFISFINLTNPTPTRQLFLDIANQISFDNTAEGEMGLLSMDFHPGFATNGYFYATYMATGGNPYRERLVRFTANPTNFVVATNTQLILFDTTKREFNHNGGDLHFGNDGYLYISMGDEGDQYDVHTNAQRLDLSLFSGILRIDVDKRPGSIEPTPGSINDVVLTVPTDGGGHAFYSIPPDNPFLGVTNYYGRPIDTSHLRAEYYAIGFRHPWRFSIDPATGLVWVGHVGQDSYEAVDLLVPGGNYGWPYYEATHLTVPLYGGAPTHPGLTNPPVGFVRDGPLYEYEHPAVPGSDPNFNGLDVIGGVVYHGAAIPQLNGAYVFGDFDIGGNIWALRQPTTNTVTVERLTSRFGIGAYGLDPRNGDVLMANYIENKIYRLVLGDAASDFPAKLSDTGIFADLATLTPNPGIVNYDPIVSFWSDYAVKRRWFTIPDLTNTVTFAPDSNWSFPTGMKWIKHFDLETVRGDPATKRRLETRVLVKTATGTFGVSYKWNDTQDEAFLVGDGGTNFFVAVQDGTNNFQQQWEIPSRAACLACHTPVAGHALSFNTRELNQSTNMNGFVGNQIKLLSDAGYFASPVAGVNTLSAFARAADTNYSLEYRVRSYLAENCVQCHQPGGAGAQSWDARPSLTLAQTRLINGVLENNGNDPLNRLIVVGDTNHSVLLRRIEGNGFERMPPLATHQLDVGSIALLTQWITTELTNRQDFAQWQVAHFGSTNAPQGDATSDPDHDGANNYYEFLTRTDPLSPTPPWDIDISTAGGNANVSYLRLANRGFLVESSGNLRDWSPWDAVGNTIMFGAVDLPVSISAPLLSGPTNQFFRVRIIEP